ncbi:TorF family putative porin [Simiduia curdlanivorans]|uniref:TorF family putative porin n=1 Tax=Simiduia curdlanivorans TaxID=1492769 RepID=A0ABV8V0S2_9GAMM|nr:TorF family putative porin [Simiduia curdlanivorans]MDN3637868.1 TorF family putative porin [Simiduia curdlanivorans]
MKLVAKSLLASAVLAASTLAAPTMAADVSANVGFNSEYFYRGIYQAESSANAGVDLESGGFYLGTWAADVGDGIEVDIYGGYTFEASDSMSFTVGFTDYEYTGDFDTYYREINLSATFGFLTVGYSDGVHGVDDGDDEDYGFWEVTAEHNGFYGKVAGFTKDAEGEYIELGYGATVSDIDLGAALIINSEELNAYEPGVKEGTGSALIFSVSKSFDL